MGEKIKQEQINFIQKIKPFLRSNTIDSFDFEPVREDRFERLLERIENIEQMLEDSEEEDGARKSKVKDQIISLLKQNRKLTSSQLGRLIGLSRTRCSEYFRELTREGITEGIIVGRKKYYKLMNEWQE